MIDPETLGILTRALKLEYLDALSGRLADPQRLDAVWSAEFQAKDHIEQLEALVRSACYLLGTPSAAMLLVTDEQSKVVVDYGNLLVLQGKEVLKNVPVESSFCQHVTDGKPFAVTNAMDDLLVCNMETVVVGGVRSYLGVPVLYSRQVVGSLCVWDMKPRTWTTTDVRVLMALTLTVQELLA